MAIVPRSTLEKARVSLIYLTLLILLIAGIQWVSRFGFHLVGLKGEDVGLSDLPSALLLSLMRMIVAYGASLVLAFLLGIPAARTAWGERLILPIIDVLQSIPVVSFFPVAIGLFISIFDGHRLGVECAAVFLIVTSLAWNLAFAVYESTKSIPIETDEAAQSFGLRGSARFFKLYMPAAIPRLAYNSILSWSNGWFFLVACEIIAVGPVKYNLPGIGSFLARSAEQDDLRQVLWGLGALIGMVLLLDQLVWRPMLVWSKRFKQEQASANEEEEKTVFQSLPDTVLDRISFVVTPLSKLLWVLVFPIRWFIREIFLPILWDLPAALIYGIWREVRVPVEPLIYRTRKFREAVGYFALGFLSVSLCVLVWRRVAQPLPDAVDDIPMSLLFSTLRITFALAVSFAWILPLIYWCWDKPKVRNAASTIAQLGASIPATALFPLIVLVGVKRLGGGVEIATLILLTFGIQWYVLFNALGGAAIIPHDLTETARSLGLTDWQMFRKLVLPAVRPALITGAITAWGGGWNALVVSEYVQSNDKVYKVRGMGSWISSAVYEAGDTPTMAIGVAVMVAWILALNLLVWQRLYHRNLDRFRLEG